MDTNKKNCLFLLQILKQKPLRPLEVNFAVLNKIVQFRLFSDTFRAIVIVDEKSYDHKVQQYQKYQDQAGHDQAT